MAKVQSLADFLGVADPVAAGGQQNEPVAAVAVDEQSLDAVRFEDLSGEEFAKAVLGSREFKRYIVNGLTLGDLPSAVLCRLMDHGWGKPPERIEHTGKDGKPIETVTEVRRVIVRAEALPEEKEVKKTYATH